MKVDERELSPTVVLLEEKKASVLGYDCSLNDSL
jgi:hypothetical protein